MINNQFTNKFQSSITKQNHLSIDSFCNSLKIVLFAFLFLILPANNVSAATLSKPANNLGLVGYWSFNDATSTSATDFSGNGNNGTLTNFASPMTSTSGWGNGKFGGGLNFDGTNDYLTTPLAPSGYAGITMSAWVNMTAFGSYPMILSYGYNTDGVPEFRSDGSGHVQVLNRQYNIGATDTFNIVGTGWHHFVATGDGTTLKLYRDGVLVATSAIAHNFNSTHPFNIGARGGDNGAGSYTWPGTLDEVRVYSRVLSATEITSLYNVSAQKFKTGVSNNGLVGYWSFNDGTSTKATDFSGNGKHGVTMSLSNPPTATSGWGVGKFGGGINFDATKFDGVSVSNATPLGSAFTFSMWVKPTSLSINQVFAGTYSGVGWLFRNSAFTNKRLEFYNGATNYTSSNTTLTTGVWQLITVTYDGSYYKFYYNGTLDYTSSPGQGAPNSESTLYISRLFGGYGVSGAIDEVRQYSRALSATEIAGLYTSGAQKINASRNVTGSSLDSGLVGLWSFDGKDINGTTAFDRSGSANNGTLTNGPVPTIGKMGQALRFDGANDFINIGNNASLFSGTGDITSSVWVKTTNTGVTQIILYNGADSTKASVYIWKSTSGDIQFGSYGQNPPDVPAFPKALIEDGNWHHIVGTKNGNTMRLYLDGTERSSSTITGVNIVPGYYYIGAFSGGGYFVGSIDEVRQYNRALTADEVKLLYNMGK